MMANCHNALSVTIVGVVSDGRNDSPGGGEGSAWPESPTLALSFIKYNHSFERVILADIAYFRNDLPSRVKSSIGWLLQTVLRPAKVKGFVVLPKRWIVERTFGWLARYRRHSKDYERSTASSEAMIYISMSIRVRPNAFSQLYFVMRGRGRT